MSLVTLGRPTGRPLIAIGGLGVLLVIGTLVPVAGEFSDAAGQEPGHTLATLDRVVPVATEDFGRVAWSRRDSVTGRYVLVTSAHREPAHDVAVPDRAVPFDVAVDRRRLVYSRCREESPVWVTARTTGRERTPRGCDLYMVDLSAGKETPIASVNTGASEYLPSIVRSYLAFVRVVDRVPRVFLARLTPRVEPLELPGTRLGRGTRGPGPVAVGLWLPNYTNINVGYVLNGVAGGRAFSQARLVRTTHTRLTRRSAFPSVRVAIVRSDARAARLILAYVAGRNDSTIALHGSGTAESFEARGGDPLAGHVIDGSLQAFARAPIVNSQGMPRPSYALLAPAGARPGSCTAPGGGVPRCVLTDAPPYTGPTRRLPGFESPGTVPPAGP